VRRLNLAIEAGGLAEMRPVVMACAAAGLGLLPAALSSGMECKRAAFSSCGRGRLITRRSRFLFVIPVPPATGSPRLHAPAKAAPDAGCRRSSTLMRFRWNRLGASPGLLE